MLWISESRNSPSCVAICGEDMFKIKRKKKKRGAGAAAVGAAGPTSGLKFH